MCQSGLKQEALISFLLQAESCPTHNPVHVFLCLSVYVCKYVCVCLYFISMSSDRDKMLKSFKRYLINKYYC